MNQSKATIPQANTASVSESNDIAKAPVAAKSPAAAKPAKLPKRTTKRDQLIKALRRKAGANILGLSETFGWEPHSTRAALSGLRKAGFVIEKSAANGSRVTTYRIVGKVETEAETLANAASATNSTEAE